MEWHQLWYSLFSIGLLSLLRFSSLISSSLHSCPLFSFFRSWLISPVCLPLLLLQLFSSIRTLLSWLQNFDLLLPLLPSLPLLILLLPLLLPAFLLVTDLQEVLDLVSKAQLCSHRLPDLLVRVRRSAVRVARRVTASSTACPCSKTPWHKNWHAKLLLKHYGSNKKKKKKKKNDNDKQKQSKNKNNKNNNYPSSENSRWKNYNNEDCNNNNHNRPLLVWPRINHLLLPMPSRSLLLLPIAQERSVASLNRSLHHLHLQLPRLNHPHQPHLHRLQLLLVLILPPLLVQM